MEAISSAAAENFSLVLGGPLYRLLVRLGDVPQERRSVVRRAIFLVAFTWLPLLLLSLAQGQAYTKHLRIPFLLDLAVLTRFLIALPILVLSELGIDRRLRHMVRHFVESGLVKAEEIPSFEAVINGIERLHNRLLPELVMLVLAYISIQTGEESLINLGWASTWHTIGIGAVQRLSYAGWWLVLVSIPLFRFFFFRWLWRIVLWSLFIWRATHLKLHLVATHPDLAAGLGFLSEGQRQFSSIVFAGGVVVSGSVGNAILYEGATLNSTRPLLITYIIVASLALIAPLLLASPALIRTRNQALFEFGALTTAHDQAFEAKWVGLSHQGAGLLGDPDASSLADLSHGMETVREMRSIPLDRRTFFALALAAALPMLPVIVWATPIDELIRDVLKILG